MYPKADLIRRFVAYLIDCILVAVISLIPVLGLIVGATYILLRDGFDFGFMRYKSLGKSLMKLEVVAFNKENKQSDFNVSLNRNWILALPLVIVIVSIIVIVPIIGTGMVVGVIVIGMVVGVIVVFTEGIKTIVNVNGRRFGDGFANTQVILSPALAEAQNAKSAPPTTPPSAQ
ncbi:MAG: hypothetical protein M0Q46_02495 [Endomicrobiales bacterium]|nr:hypothetical protein [Endomicrobiales bacterium]